MLGVRYLVSLIDSPEGTSAFAQSRVPREWFKGEEEVWLYDAVCNHVQTHGVLPHKTTLLEEKPELFLPPAPEPPDYYLNKVRERFLQKILKDGLEVVQKHTDNDDPTAAVSALTEVVSRSQMFIAAERLLDFGAAGYDLIWDQYVKQNTDPDYGIKLGWPTLDKMTSGLSGGDIVALIGRPGQGKSYALLAASNHVWQKQNKSVMFVSMEMKPLLIAQRLAAIALKLPITGLKEAALSTAEKNKLKQGFVDFKNDAGKKFWVVDGGLTVTVRDLVMLARQLRPDLIVIDGAYMLRGSSPRLPRWEKITETTEAMKADLAQGLDVPVIASYQFTRESTKKKKKDAIGLEDIAGADAVGQIASVVLGLLQEEDIESMMVKKLEILKGRSGEVGSFEINWRFDEPGNYMDFSEVTNLKEDQELDFI